MSTQPGFYPLPQSGYHTDMEYALAFDEDVTTFRKKCHQNGIPVSKWGNATVVLAEDLHAFFRDRRNEEEVEEEET